MRRSPSEEILRVLQELADPQPDARSGSSPASRSS